MSKSLANTQSSNSAPPLFTCNTVQEWEDAPWKPVQVFYTAEPPHTQEVDLITAAAFSQDGDHIAIGDKAGRIWIYSTDKGRNRCKPKQRMQNKQTFSLFTQEHSNSNGNPSHNIRNHGTGSTLKSSKQKPLALDAMIISGEESTSDDDDDDDDDDDNDDNDNDSTANTDDTIDSNDDTSNDVHDDTSHTIPMDIEELDQDVSSLSSCSSHDHDHDRRTVATAMESDDTAPMDKKNRTTNALGKDNNGDTVQESIGMSGEMSIEKRDKKKKKKRGKNENQSKTKGKSLLSQLSNDGRPKKRKRRQRSSQRGAKRKRGVDGGVGIGGGAKEKRALRRRKKKDARIISDFYDFYGQFQSHQPGFDFLKSLEIEPRINCISWCKTGMNYLTLIAANDKTIKLWKVFEKSIIQTEGASSHETYVSKQARKSDCEITVPSVMSADVITAAISRRVYNEGHKFHIHSLDVNPDCETFISADDLRINLWHFDSPSDYYLLCDKKPENMEDLMQTITTAFLHPRHCSLMAYATSRGETVLCDMRTNAKLIHNDTVFAVERSELSRNFYGDVAASIRHGCFTNDGSCIVTRDFFNSYVWDIRQNDKPFQTIPILPYFQDDLVHLYRSDCLFDRFTVSVSNNMRNPSLASGGYDNSFVVANWNFDKDCIPTLQKCTLDTSLIYDPTLSQNPNPSLSPNSLVATTSSAVAASAMSTSPSGLTSAVAGGGVSSSDETLTMASSPSKTCEVVIKNDHFGVGSHNGVDIAQSNHFSQLGTDTHLNTLNSPHWLKETMTDGGENTIRNRVSHVLWHPNKDTIAAVSGTALYMFRKID